MHWLQDSDWQLKPAAVQCLAFASGLSAAAGL